MFYAKEKKILLLLKSMLRIEKHIIFVFLMIF